MPSYVFDYITSEGPRRESFTVDDDRPMGAQVRRVLAELRQRGIILLGGRDDELSIEWNGIRIDEALTPITIGLSAIRPVELRMRPRNAPRVAVRAEVRAGTPRVRFVPLGVISAALAGALGGACAWTLLSGLPTGAMLTEDRDALAGVMFIASVGLFTVLLQHGLTRRLALAAVGLGAGAVLTTALAMGASVAVSGAHFIVQRLVLMMVLGALGGLTFAVTASQIGSLPALLETAGLGLIGGGSVALFGSIPSLGVSSALAWPLFGAALAASAVWPRLRRAYALCELLPARRSVLGTLTMQSYPLARTGALRLGRDVSVHREGAEIIWTAPGVVVIEGKVVRGTAVAVNGDHVQTGSRVYRYRELP